MTKIFQTLAFLMGFLSLSQCIEPVTIVTKDNQETLVIEGRFTNNSEELQEIRLGFTGEFGATPQSISNARVTVKSTDGTIFSFFERDTGRYISNEKGEVGKAYFVEITLPNGKIFQSDPEIMPAPVDPDSVTWARGALNELSTQGIPTSKPTLDIFVSTPLRVKGKDNFLRWDLHDGFEWSNLPTCNLGTRITCYYGQRNTNGTMAILSSRLASVERINKFKVGYTPFGEGYPFLEKYAFSVFQYSITAKAYDYWGKYNAVISQGGSIFDKIPARVQGNVFDKSTKEAAIGYFEVSGMSIKRIFTYYGDVKAAFPFLLDKGQYCADIPCCTCLTVKAPNPTLTRPVWWQ